MKITTIAVGLASLLLTGCASIVSGHNQSLSVVTKSGNEDVAGARCSLTNDKGQWFATTPGSVTVRRSYSAMAVDCKTDQTAGVVSVKSSTKPMAFGNVIFGGVIGVGVDVATGAAYDYPDVITVLLASAGSPAPAAAPVEPVTPVAVAVQSPAAAPVPLVPPATPSPPPPAAAPSVEATVAKPAPKPLAAAPAVVMQPAAQGGKDSYSVRKVAQALQCSDTPAPVLTAKSPGTELYTVACKSGPSLAVQCDFGSCRALQ